MTRSAVQTATTEPERIAAAVETSPTALVCLQVLPEGPGGIQLITAPSSGKTPTVYLPSMDLATALLAAVSDTGIPTRPTLSKPDPVLQAVGRPGVCVTLGSLSDAADERRFSDPTWADRIARALYGGIASVYGVDR